MNAITSLRIPEVNSLTCRVLEVLRAVWLDANRTFVTTKDSWIIGDIQIQRYLHCWQ